MPGCLFVCYKPLASLFDIGCHCYWNRQMNCWCGPSSRGLQKVKLSTVCLLTIAEVLTAKCKRGDCFCLPFYLFTSYISSLLFYLYCLGSLFCISCLVLAYVVLVTIDVIKSFISVWLLCPDEDALLYPFSPHCGGCHSSVISTEQADN